MNCHCLSHLFERLTEDDLAVLTLLSLHPEACREDLLIQHRVPRARCDIALHRLLASGLIEFSRSGRKSPIPFPLGENGL